MPEILTHVLTEALRQLKAHHITELDVRELTDFTDTLIIVTGTSDRHVKALAEAAMEASKKAGASVLSCEGMEDCEWVLVDLGDIVVHIMQPRVRDYYYLEGLWDPAKRHEKQDVSCH